MSGRNEQEMAARALHLDKLCEQAWNEHGRPVNVQLLQKPSAPVLYFGNLAKFEQSELRVVTVALNPSPREFPPPPEGPFFRFPNTQSYSKPDYLNALTGYFDHEPLKDWFKNYDAALMGMRASYYRGQPNTALHTDIGSVLATRATWGDLTKGEQEQLRRVGVDMWHQLIEHLEPHIILISMAREWLNRIRFDAIGEWVDVCEFEHTQDGSPRAAPYSVKARWHRLSNSHPVMIAFGPGSQKPLGKIDHGLKAAAGARIVEEYKKGRLRGEAA